MPTFRVPLTQPIESRQPNFAKDSRSVNCYFETRDQKREMIKRPGLKKVAQLATSTYPTLTQGQGLAEFRNQIISIIDNQVKYTDPTTYDSLVIGTITGPLTQNYFVKDFLDKDLIFHNSASAYTISSSYALKQIKNDYVVAVTMLTAGSGYVSGVATFSAPPAGGVTATGDVVIEGTGVVSITITNPGSGYVTAPTVTITGGTVNATASTTLNAFPTGDYVPGIVFLDQYVFIGACNNRIYNSNLNEPTKWSALDYISFEQGPDRLLGIARHFNYLVAFGEWSIQFYYDAGTATGSPLAVASSYMSEIGCVNGSSIVQTEQSIFWVGKSKANGPSVYLLEGTSPIRISTHSIERFLQASCLEKITAYTVKVNGHLFYVLTLHDLNVTLVYDATEKMWVQWSQWAVASSDQPAPGLYAESYFRPSYYAQVLNKPFVLDDDNGTLYELDSYTYNDNKAPIYFRAVTDVIDSGTTKRKFYNRVEIIGDKVPATMKIRHTGDDYNNWSSYRNVSLNSPRAQIYQTGQDRRRAWEFLCTDDVPLRIDAAEIDFSVGELDQESNIGAQPYRR